MMTPRNADTRRLALAALIAMAFTAAPAFAQHSDIELGGSPGAIEVEEPEAGEVWHSLDSTEDPAGDTRLKQSVGELYETIFPGIAHGEDGPATLSPNADIFVRPLSRIWYWHPIDQPAFGDAPGNETIRLESTNPDIVDLSNAGIVFDTDTGSDGLIYLTTSDGTGAFHTHLNVTLYNADDPGVAIAAIGAYLTMLSVVSSLDGETDPVWVLWNRGLSDADWADAVEAAASFAFGSPVPTPSAATMIAALACAATLRRRRSV